MKITKLKVSFINKDTMKAINPEHIYLETDSDGFLTAYMFDEEFINDDKEVEIKVL